jgi:hypothetical protein
LWQKKSVSIRGYRKGFAVLCVLRVSALKAFPFGCGSAGNQIKLQQRLPVAIMLTP